MAGDASRRNGQKGGRPKGPTARTLAKRRGQARALQLAEVTAERTMLEIARLALTDRRGIWKDGKLKPLTEWTPDEAALLEGLEVIIKNAEAGDGHTDTVHKVRLATKLNALDILAKHFGLYSNKLEVKGKIRLEDLVAGAMQDDSTT